MLLASTKWQGPRCPGKQKTLLDRLNGYLLKHEDKRSNFTLDNTYPLLMGFPGGSVDKESSYSEVMQVWSLGQQDPLEEGMATHSSILAWRIPWTKKPGRLQSLGSHSVEH